MKVVIIISNIDRWMTFEWMTLGLRKWFDLHFVLLNVGNSYFEQFLQENGFNYDRVVYHGKRSMPGALLKVIRVLSKIQPQVVHTHFLDANLVGLMAAKLTKVPKRIHTRHHSVFHHRYSKKGVWYDRWSNRLSTQIVAITKMVARVLEEKEKVNPDKIWVIHHGFDLEAFNPRDEKFVKNFRETNGIGKSRKVIGVISRYIEWKGIEYIIDAFGEFHREHPESLLLLLNARGPERQSIQRKLSELPNDSFREIPFEKNILAVYDLFHVFVHVPIDEEVEAFGQVYVESLASGVPSVFTKSGIAWDFIEDGKNAVIVDYRDSEAIHEGLERIWADRALRKRLRMEGLQSVQVFKNEDFCHSLKELYET